MGMTRLEIRAEPADLLPGERLQAVVGVVNDGPSVLHLPNPRAGLEQPIYRLQGPAAPQGETRSNRGGGCTTDDPAKAEPMTVAVPAGGRWDGIVPLGAVEPPALPGDYTLSIGYALVTGFLRSQPAAFRVAEWGAPALAAGFGVSLTGEGEGRGAFLLPTSGGAGLYTFAYQETRPDLSEFGTRRPVLRRRVGPGAADAGIAVRNTGFFADADGRVAWREGAEVAVMDDTGREARWRLEAPPASLVQPPLWPADSPVEVLALAADRRALTLVRFPARAAAQPGWTVPLPFPAAAAAAAIGPGGAAAERAVALFGQAPDGALHVALLRWGAGGSPAAPAAARLAGTALLPGAGVSAFLGADGRGLAAAIIRQGAETLLLELAFPRGGGAPTLESRPFGPLARAPVVGGVLHSPGADGGLRRREAVLSFADGGLLVLRDAGPPYALTPAGLPAAPLVLVPGENRGAVIRLSPATGPRADPL